MMGIGEGHGPSPFDPPLLLNLILKYFYFNVPIVKVFDTNINVLGASP